MYSGVFKYRHAFTYKKGHVISFFPYHGNYSALKIFYINYLPEINIFRNSSLKKIERPKV